MISLGPLRVSDVVQYTQDWKTVYYASLLISQFYLVFNNCPLKIYLSGFVLSIPECASLSLINIFRKKECCPSVCIQLKCIPNMEYPQHYYSLIWKTVEILLPYFIDLKTFCLLLPSWFLYFSHFFSENSLKLNIEHFVKYWRLNFVRCFQSDLIFDIRKENKGFQ